MTTPILAPKLFVPPLRAKIVLRSRLIERLNEGLSAGDGLILVSAPAGFGKTTLISEWLAGCQRPAAWLTLDEGDNDPACFLAYLVAALQTVAANVGQKVMAMLQSSQLPPTRPLLTALLNEISTIPDDFILVLDDYHLLNTKPGSMPTSVEQALTVDMVLNSLVEHRPPRMRLVIASREDPPLPLARLRARGQLVELRAADLRFTLPEAAEFLTQVMGLNLSAENIAALEKRTEGWIAGLQLASLALQGNALAEPEDVMQMHLNTTRFIQNFTGSHRFVLDYLVEEVLQQQSESVQDFLLRTSILNRLCGSLCDALLPEQEGTAQEAGQETLEYLERANLFVVPLDNERFWYRYHHLFKEILRQRLGQRLSPGEITENHLRASRWYEKYGDVAEAFHHALAAGDYQRSAELAELSWQGMDGTFQSATWLGWVKELPEDVTRIRPMLSTQMGWALMDMGEPEASESRLQDAEWCLNGPSDAMVVVDKAQLKPLPAMIAMARAYNAQVQGNLSATMQYAKLALQHIPEDDFFRRAQATIMLEFTHWASGDLESARSAMVEWMRSMQHAGNFAFVVASAFAVADILVEQGRLREAEKTYQRSIQLASEHGKDVQAITAHHYLGLAMLQHEMGDDAAAANYLQKAQELGEQTTLVDWPYRWHLAQARLKESVGDLDAALALLDEAKRVYVKNPVPLIQPVEALKAIVYLKQGRLAKAQDWARQRGLTADDETNYLGEFEHLTLARVLIAEYQNRQGRPSFLQAIGLLERLLKAAEAQGRTASVIEILVLQALAHQVQDNLPLALASLQRALFLAQPEGYVRIFVDEGEPVRRLLLNFRSWLEKQSGDQDHPRLVYVEKLLSAFEHAVGNKPTTGSVRPDLIEPLSERELEVLRLIAQGLTNQEIGRRLVLALSTVKGHNSRILSKLQTQNRTEAVVRARELGLL